MAGHLCASISPAAQLRLRGAGTDAKRRRTASPVRAHTENVQPTESNATALTSEADAAGTGAEANNESTGVSLPETDNGMVSDLLRDMKEVLRKGEIPHGSPGASGASCLPVPKRGPGSVHRTKRLHGWSKNPGGDYGIELPDGELAGGGCVLEPKRVEWAKRLANASDTAAYLGHKLVKLCDNVSVALDPLTEKGPFLMDLDAALECLEQVLRRRCPPTLDNLVFILSPSFPMFACSMTPTSQPLPSSQLRRALFLQQHSRIACCIKQKPKLGVSEAMC